MPVMTLARRLFLLVIAALIVWRVAALGISAHYAELPRASAEAAAKALVWSPRHPEALYRRALALREEDPDAAVPLLTRAYAENPADVRPLMTLAELAQMRGEQDRAEALLAAALRLAPADPRVHRRAADYWIARGDLDTALSHWSAALDIDPSRNGDLFPVLLRLAEDSRTRLALRPLALAPPNWWESFFAGVAEKARDLETIRTLYALRRESPRVPVTDAERKAFVERMMASGRIAEAYVDWVGGLDREQRRELGFLHNGSFELEPLNWGFGWRIRSDARALVDRGTTFGIDGTQALRLIFRNHAGRFAGVSQSLFLDPGRYRFAGRVSTDGLDSVGGIRWQVRCLLPENGALGASERFLGANEWRDFAFDFEVPESCALQELRLASAGERELEQRVTGGAWFDRLAIRRINDRARAPASGAAGPAANDE
jgi:tetratricopeptide (TPR) repeat protein